MPKFTIVIPTYNESEYLEKLLYSLKNQMKKNVEIIVSDSGSTDETCQIARKYGAKVVMGPRKGPALGRNLGAKKARGEYLLFLDADCIVVAELLKVLESEIDENHIIYSVKFKPDRGKILDLILFELYNILNPLLIKYAPSLAICSGQFICIRKDIFNRIGGFNQKLRLSEDRELMFMALRHGKPKFIKRTFIITSMRRIEKWGWTKYLLFHAYSHLYYTLFKKSPELLYEEIR